MALNPHDAVADDLEDAPRLLLRPSEAPALLGHVGDTNSVQSFRRIWESRRAGPASGSPASRVRAWAARVSGRADRHLLFSLAQATDAVAAQVDLLADRLASQEVVTANVTHVYGEEITRLRAEVIHLRHVTASLRDVRDE